MTTRRQLLGTALASGAWLAYPSLSMASSPTEGVRGGTLSIALTPEPPIIVNAFNTSTPVASVASKMFDSLIYYDNDLKAHPCVADSWESSSDGSTFTIHLHPGIFWHDGKELGSNDVKFSLLNIWKTLHAYGRAAYKNVVSVETPDKYTVVLHLSAPAPYVRTALAQYISQILPEHLYANTNIRQNPYNLKPVGFGPFKFKEWKRGNYLIMERNEHYWRKGLPYLDQIIFRFIPDASARSTAFREGAVQLGGMGNGVPLNELTDFEKSKRFKVTTKGTEYTSIMFLNELNVTRKPLNDVRVRQAILHATNRKALLDVVWYGYGKIATGPVASATKEWYNPDTPQYEYNIERANALLDAAGYPKKNGTRFKLVYYYLPYGSDFENTALFQKQNLKQVGIDVDVRGSDIGTYIKTIYSDYDYDMTCTNFTTTPDPTLGVQRLYWSENIVKGVPYSNGSGYRNPEMDKLWIEAQTEKDEAVRKKLFDRIQVIAQTDLPLLDLFEVQAPTVSTKTLMNYAESGLGMFESYADVYFTNGRKA